MGGGRDVHNAPSIKNYGFDEYISTYESPDPEPAITATNWIWSAKDSVKRWRRTEYFVNKSIDFVKRHKDQPFFLNLWPDDMHTPWVPEFKQKDNKSWNTEEAFIPAGGPTLTNITVADTALGTGTAIAHPGANLGTATAQNLTTNTLYSRTWTYTLGGTPASWAAGTYSGSVTYTATTL